MSDTRLTITICDELKKKLKIDAVKKKKTAGEIVVTLIKDYLDSEEMNNSSGLDNTE